MTRHLWMRPSAAALIAALATGTIAAQTTELVSQDGAGTEGNAHSFMTDADRPISADGNVVTFHSTANNLVVGDTNIIQDIFVHDRAAGTTTLISRASDGSDADAFSFNPAISADGRFVAFWTSASNLVPGDNNGRADIFVHDRVDGTTTRVSVASDGSEGNGSSVNPSISADGNLVAFRSNASTLAGGNLASSFATALPARPP